MTAQLLETAPRSIESQSRPALPFGLELSFTASRHSGNAHLALIPAASSSQKYPQSGADDGVFLDSVLLAQFAEPHPLLLRNSRSGRPSPRLSESAQLAL